MAESKSGTEEAVDCGYPGGTKATEKQREVAKIVRYLITQTGSVTVFSEVGSAREEDAPLQSAESAEVDTSPRCHHQRVDGCRSKPDEFRHANAIRRGRKRRRAKGK